jgi:hypothetical protein
MKPFLLIFSFFIISFSLQCTAIADESGELQLMPQLNQAPNGSQTPRGIQNPNIQIPQNVGNAAAQPALFDIYGPVPTREPIPYLLIGLILAALLALAALFYFLSKRRKEKLPPPVPPWDIALSELAEAKSIRTPEHGLTYMDKVSQILRRYIESRFTLQTTRQTTMEFLRSKPLHNNPDLHNFKEDLQECLEQADMAKFAHRIPDNNHLNRMEDSVTTFVVKTKPDTQPDKGSGGKQ